MIYLIITFIIDILLSNLFSINFQNLSYFSPLILISSLNVTYLLIKNDKVFITSLLTIGIIYDILFTNYYFINLYFFLLAALLIIKFYKNRQANFLNILASSVVLIGFYDTYVFIILNIIGDYTFNQYNLIYKISHTIILNLAYVLTSIILLKCRIFKNNNKFKSKSI